MSFIFVIAIAIAINLDNLLIGLQLGLQHKKMPFYANLTIACMTAAATFLASMTTWLFNEKIITTGGILAALFLIVFGVYNMLCAQNEAAIPDISPDISTDIFNNIQHKATGEGNISIKKQITYSNNSITDNQYLNDTYGKSDIKTKRANKNSVKNPVTTTNHSNELSFKRALTLGVFLSANCIPPALCSGILSIHPIALSLLSGLFSFLSMWVSYHLSHRLVQLTISKHLCTISNMILIVVGSVELVLQIL